MDTDSEGLKLLYFLTLAMAPLYGGAAVALYSIISGFREPGRTVFSMFWPLWLIVGAVMLPVIYLNSVLEQKFGGKRRPKPVPQSRVKLKDLRPEEGLGEEVARLHAQNQELMDLLTEVSSCAYWSDTQLAWVIPAGNDREGPMIKVREAVRGPKLESVRN